MCDLENFYMVLIISLSRKIIIVFFQIVSNDEKIFALLVASDGYYV